jgi:hypothetical protein
MYREDAAGTAPLFNPTGQVCGGNVRNIEVPPAESD